MPGVLLKALSEYKFVGTPLWRMSDGKDLVRVELTFHKKLPTPRFYKKGAESRRQPAPPAGEWSRQPAPATRLPPRRVSTQMEKETLPPPTQTVLQALHQIIRIQYSYHHRIADHHQTSTSVSRDTASEESQKRVSSARSLDPVLLIPLRRRVPDSREIRPPGRSQQQISWTRRCNHKGIRIIKNPRRR